MHGDNPEWRSKALNGEWEVTRLDPVTLRCKFSECRAEFQTTSRRQAYCSTNCNKLASRKRLNRRKQNGK